MSVADAPKDVQQQQHISSPPTIIGRSLHFYSLYVVRRPGSCTILASVVFLIFSVLGMLIGPELAFSDASAGFEARGTPISDSRIAYYEHRCWPYRMDWKRWDCIYEEAQPLFVETSQFIFPGDYKQAKQQHKNKHKPHERRVQSSQSSQTKPSSPTSRKILSEAQLQTNGTIWPLFSPGSIGKCSSKYYAAPTVPITSSYDNQFPVFVFESTNAEEGLLTISALKAVCEVDAMMKSSEYLTSFYNEELFEPYGKCDGRSIGHWFAAWESTDCLSLTQEQVDRGIERLIDCASYFYSGELNEYCGSDLFDDEACGAPLACDAGLYAGNGVYDIFRHLVQYTFLDPELTSQETGAENIIYSAENPPNLQLARLISSAGNDDTFDDMSFEDIGTILSLYRNELRGLWRQDEFNGYTGAKITSFYTEDMLWELFNSTLFVESTFAVGAAVLILIILIVHTGNCFVATMGYFQVIT